MTFQIILRDRSSEPCRFLIEEVADIDYENLDPRVDLAEEETEVGAIKRFIEKASQIALPHNNIDVYIGWWLDQGGIEIPHEFFALIADREWKVTLDIND